MIGSPNPRVIFDAGGVIFEIGTGPSDLLLPFVFERVSMAEKWAALDMMGVVAEVSDDVKDLLVPYIQQKDKNISPREIEECYLRASLGKISSAEFWRLLGLGSGYRETEKGYLDSCPRLDPEFIGVARQLKTRCSLALLSNDVKEWSTYLRERFAIEEFFLAVVVSGEVGCRKPDRKIYEILLDRLQAAPSDCVLIDDRARNLRPARELGMKTIRFARQPPDEEFAADAEIARFSELPDILERLWR